VDLIYLSHWVAEWDGKVPRMCYNKKLNFVIFRNPLTKNTGYIYLICVKGRDAEFLDNLRYQGFLNWQGSKELEVKLGLYFRGFHSPY